jgi:hypothetical protein
VSKKDEEKEAGAGSGAADSCKKSDPKVSAGASITSLEGKSADTGGKSDKSKSIDKTNSKADSNSKDKLDPKLSIPSGDKNINAEGKGSELKSVKKTPPESAATEHVNTKDGESSNDASGTNAIDFESVDYKAFDEIDKDHIDLYYELNDNKNNPEFLDEDLVSLSRREEETRAFKLREKEEFDFELEELVDNDRIKVDLTGIVNEKTEK